MNTTEEKKAYEQGFKDGHACCADQIKKLEEHIEKMSCCCAGCTKHNLNLEDQ